MDDDEEFIDFTRHVKKISQIFFCDLLLSARGARNSSWIYYCYVCVLLDSVHDEWFFFQRWWYKKFYMWFWLEHHHADVDNMNLDVNNETKKENYSREFQHYTLNHSTNHSQLRFTFTHNFFPQRESVSDSFLFSWHDETIFVRKI